MKHLFLSIGIIALSSGLFSACTSSQAPPIASSNIAGLNVPDTINMGFVRLGTTKDTLVAFRNSSSDTIQITSQSLTGTSFQLLATSPFSIAPGESKLIGIGFTPNDTSIQWGVDTIRTQDKHNVIILLGSAIPFSSLFFSAPSGIVVTLSGLMSNDNGQDGGNRVHNFYFSTPAYDPGQWGDTIEFYSSYDYSNLTERIVDEGMTMVRLHIDTANKQIDWLDASSNVDQGGTFDWNDIWQEIVIHGLTLKNDSAGWSGTVTGSNLSDFVSSVQYAQTIPGYTEDQLISVSGYQSTASLSVLIW